MAASFPRSGTAENGIAGDGKGALEHIGPEQGFGLSWGATGICREVAGRGDAECECSVSFALAPMTT